MRAKDFIFEGDVIRFPKKKTNLEKYSDAFSKQHNDEHRYGVGHIPCDYCGEVNCDYDCDGSQADGELDESFKKKAAAALVGLGLLATPTAIQHTGITPKQQSTKPVGALNRIESMLKSVANQANIEGHELAQFLGQAAHETGDFDQMNEIGGRQYLIHKYWDNVVTRNALGNIYPEDAIRYRGRGFIQLSGRGNYDKMGQKLNIDLVKNPKLAARPDIAAKILVLWFKDNIEPKVTDFTNTQEVTNKINPHDKPESRLDREKKYQKYKDLLGLQDK